MRIAFFSDIHGNVEALRAVLADINDKGVDGAVCVGDLIAFGPRPLEVLETLGSMDNLLLLQGNTERWLATIRDEPEGPWDEKVLAKVAPALKWTLERVPAEVVEQLVQLGKAGTLQADGHEIEVEHASPGSDWVGIQPGTTTEDLEEMFSGCDFHAFVCGHTHKPIIRNVGKTLVVNDGSVGYPYDTIRNPSWALMTTSPARVETVIHRVEYDSDAVKKDIEQVGMVWGDVMIRRLDTGKM